MKCEIVHNYNAIVLANTRLALQEGKRPEDTIQTIVDRILNKSEQEPYIQLVKAELPFNRNFFKMSVYKYIKNDIKI